MGTAPTGYQTPKTNWAAGNIPTASDFNRIESNIQAVEEGSRTIDPAQAPTGNSGSLRQFLDWLANRIKAITGKTNWYDAPDITLASLAQHKSRHATGGADALSPADIGAASAADLTAHLADVAPHSGYVAQLGADNQVVNLFKALNQQIDTRNVTLTYDANGRLTTVTEKDGATTVKTTSLSYDANGNLTTVTEQVAGKTITITLTYDASGNLTSIARSVT